VLRTAQDQEKKLVDRLLKPDMTLQNDAQNKKFVGTVGCLSINAQTSGRFSFTRNRARKVFLEHETSPQRQFYSQTYRGGRTGYEVRHSKHLQIPRLPSQIRRPRHS